MANHRTKRGIDGKKLLKYNSHSIYIFQNKIYDDKNV